MHAANADLWDVIRYGGSQVRTAVYGEITPMGGMITSQVIAFEYPALLMVAERIGVAVDRGFLDRLWFFEANVVNLLKEGHGCDARMRASCEANFGEYIEWACAHCDKKKG